MKDRGVIFKGTGKALKVVISDEADMADALTEIERKLSANPAFYMGQRISVESKSGPIPDEHSNAIKAIFGRYGISCSVMDARSAAERAAALITQTVLKEERLAGELGRKAEEDDEDAYSEAAIFRGDVVPGKSLMFDGSALILGDVLPGAKVLASGDIIITGIAGGIVHAGWPDDREARIIAGGFAAGEYNVGDLKTELKESHGSQLRLYSLVLGQDGLRLKQGEAGMLLRRQIKD